MLASTTRNMSWPLCRAPKPAETQTRARAPTRQPRQSACVVGSESECDALDVRDTELSAPAIRARCTLCACAMSTAALKALVARAPHAGVGSDHSRSCMWRKACSSACIASCSAARAPGAAKYTRRHTRHGQGASLISKRVRQDEYALQRAWTHLSEKSVPIATEAAGAARRL